MMTLGMQDLKDELGRSPVRAVVDWKSRQAGARGLRVLFGQWQSAGHGGGMLRFDDEQGNSHPMPVEGGLREDTLVAALKKLRHDLGVPLLLWPHGPLTKWARHLPEIPGVEVSLLGYASTLDPPEAAPESTGPLPPHLRRLEAESIGIIREAVAEAEHPAMLYSIGKDSSVMLHLARKAFYPGLPPFPLLHVDTRWKFRDMYLLRDHVASDMGLELRVHVNPEAVERDINPFDHGSALHTDITKTQGLKQALDLYRFDVVFGGARRDEEKSRAKERVFSFRSQTHRWDPKNQRPELWNLYNTRKHKGESIRVFPLSNWTELDIWQYIYFEHIPVVPLYFSRKRPVVVRDGMILMVDDDRFRFQPGEVLEERAIRFRTLGCYPLTGAVESSARNVPEIILELLGARQSERQGRAIDSDASSSMEKKKQEGYF